VGRRRVAARGSFYEQRADEEVAGAVEDAEQFERGYESEWLRKHKWFWQRERAAWAEWWDDWIRRRYWLRRWFWRGRLESKSAGKSAAAGWRELRPWIAVEQ
jgi:hypothetical protein